MALANPAAGAPHGRAGRPAPRDGGPSSASMEPAILIAPEWCRLYNSIMSGYLKGRTALGDVIAAELAKSPNSPRNRANRAVGLTMGCAITA